MRGASIATIMTRHSVARIATMTADLRKLAHAAREEYQNSCDGPSVSSFKAAVSPDVVLGLLDSIDYLQALPVPADYVTVCIERDRLREALDGLIDAVEASVDDIDRPEILDAALEMAISALKEGI
jgi:hypothetical protein